MNKFRTIHYFTIFKYHSTHKALTIYKTVLTLINPIKTGRAIKNSHPQFLIHRNVWKSGLQNECNPTIIDFLLGIDQDKYFF